MNRQVTITIDKSSYKRKPIRKYRGYYHYNTGWFMCVESQNGTNTMRPLQLSAGRLIRWFQLKYYQIKLFLKPVK